MACLDTSFLIDLLKGKPQVIELKEELDKNEKALSIPAPVVMELWLGASLARIPAKEKEKVNDILQSMQILSLDEKSAKEAAEIESELTKRGLNIETEDIMIAAIAKANGEKLVTSDNHFARIAGLRLLKY